jgi:hypothetical protein
MANDINIVVAAQVQGAIRPLQQVQQQLGQVDRTINRSTAALRQNANQFNSTAVSINKFAKGALQQAGFQIGDYAVQVANGTSAMQAFGQQGAQMLGVFGPIGAVLGAAVAIFSAVAVAAERSGKEVSNFGSVFGQLQEPLTATVDAVRGFAASFGNVMPFVVNNIDTAIIAGGILAAVFGVKMVRSMIASAGAGTIMTAAMVQVRAAVLASAIATGRFNVALIAMRSAALLTGAAFTALGAILMRFLPVAILLGLAKAVEMFLQLRRGAGSAGEAFLLLRDVATEAFERIRLRGERMYLTLSSGINQFKLNFINALIPVAEAFDRFAMNLSDKWNNMFPEDSLMAPLRINIAEGFADQLEGASGEIQTTIDGIATRLGEIDTALDKPNQSMAALRDAFKNGATEVSIFGAASEEALGKTGRAAKDVQEKISDLRKSIEGSMESAFMSIIDGTKSVKDAFRSMASEIIKELYRVFVVQRLVGMISNAVSLFTGPAPGSAASILGTPSTRSFAGGGYTGMGSRSGGVDGRGGFPAILHPNETVVDHSAGQGMGTVVVNQTINISTGVQQTVRSEIKQLMPQIAESAKQAVVDAKRRGGSYGRAFA